MLRTRFLKHLKINIPRRPSDVLVTHSEEYYFILFQVHFPITQIVEHNMNLNLQQIRVILFHLVNNFQTWMNHKPKRHKWDLEQAPQSYCSYIKKKKSNRSHIYTLHRTIGPCSPNLMVRNFGIMMVIRL